MVASKDLFGILYLIKKFGTLEYRTRIQKLILLGKLEFQYPFSYEFKRYNFGPFSSELQEHMSKLVSDGLISEQKVILEHGVQYKYNLTKVGEEILNSLQKDIDSELKEKLNRLFAKYKGMKVNQIITAAKEKFGW